MLRWLQYLPYSANVGSVQKARPEAPCHGDPSGLNYFNQEVIKNSMRAFRKKVVQFLSERPQKV
jgi:hypothetical protein